MTMGVNDTTRSSWMTDVKNAIDAGSSGGKIKFYNGTRPSKGGAATTLLGTIICAHPCGTVSGGVLTFSSFTDESNTPNSGTATWARITDSNDNFVADCDVTITGGGGDITLNSVTISAGGIIHITSGTLTAGNA